VSPLDPKRAFRPIGIAVLTVSDSRTPQTDRSGDLLAERITRAGRVLGERGLVTDDPYRVRAMVAGWCIREDLHAILLTGGTGLTGRDGTPEAVRPLFDKKIPGFGELFRHVSFADIGASTLESRALAGLSNGHYIFCLPGSPNACATAWDRILEPQLDYRTRPCNLVELLPRLQE